MIVKELIERLNQFDDSLAVYFANGDFRIEIRFAELPEHEEYVIVTNEYTKETRLGE